MVSLGKNSALLDRFTEVIREDEIDPGANHLYSVAALTNQAGAVVERYRYDTYGQRTVLAPDGVTTRAASLYGQQVGFTGRYLDKETGLWYFRARYYSGSLGRFIGRDPLRYFSGTNFYRAYFIPNASDPSGMSPYTDCIDEKTKGSQCLKVQNKAADDCIGKADEGELKRMKRQEDSDPTLPKSATDELKRREERDNGYKEQDKKTAEENERIRELGRAPEPGHDSPGHDSDSPGKEGEFEYESPSAGPFIGWKAVEQVLEKTRTGPGVIAPIIEVFEMTPAIIHTVDVIRENNRRTNEAIEGNR